MPKPCCKKDIVSLLLRIALGTSRGGRRRDKNVSDENHAISSLGSEKQHRKYPTDDFQLGYKLASMQIFPKICTLPTATVSSQICQFHLHKVPLAWSCNYCIHFLKYRIISYLNFNSGSVRCMQDMMALFFFVCHTHWKSQFSMAKTPKRKKRRGTHR